MPRAAANAVNRLYDMVMNVKFRTLSVCDAVSIDVTRRPEREIGCKYTYKSNAIKTMTSRWRRFLDFRNNKFAKRGKNRLPANLPDPV